MSCDSLCTRLTACSRGATCLSLCLPQTETLLFTRLPNKRVNRVDVRGNKTGHQAKAFAALHQETGLSQRRERERKTVEQQKTKKVDDNNSTRSPQGGRSVTEEIFSSCMNGRCTTSHVPCPDSSGPVYTSITR